MKEAIIFGAGNIGRGFIGQLFSESGFAITLVDIDRPLLKALNDRQGYTIRLVNNENAEDVFIHPVRGLESYDRDNVIQVVRRANLGATAVGARVLPQIAPLIAAGISLRAIQNETEPLNLIICENLKDAAAVFREMIYSHLTSEERTYAQNHLGLVDTVIGRMVPPPTPEMRQEDPGLILVEPYKELPVDRNGFIGKIPSVTGMEPCDRFPAYTARKLYIHNCGHACLAYLGYLKGYEYGYQALIDPGILSLVKASLSESKIGIVSQFGVSVNWLEDHINDLLIRFSNRSLGDTIYRLGRDPVRKLAPNDRLVGAARLAEKAGLKPSALCKGIAAAYCFEAGEDPITCALQEQIRTIGIRAVLMEVSQIKPDEPLGVMVLNHYRSMKTGSIN